ncbi:MAG: PKD domain-containing protein [bacterium]
MEAERGIIRLSSLLIIVCLYIFVGITYSHAQKIDMNEQLLSGSSDLMRMLYTGMANPIGLGLGLGIPIGTIEQAIIESTMDLKIGGGGQVNPSILIPTAPALGGGAGAFVLPHVSTSIGYRVPYNNLVTNANLGMGALQQMTYLPAASLSTMNYQVQGLPMQGGPMSLPYSGVGIGAPSLVAPIQTIGTSAPLNLGYVPSIADSFFLRSQNKPPSAEYYTPYYGSQYSSAEMYPYPGTEYYIDTYNLGLDLFNPNFLRPSLPGGFIVTITETALYEEAPITEGVEIYLYDQLITPQRSGNGLYYYILLQRGPFRLLFRKEGYIDFPYPPNGSEGYIIDSVPQYLQIRMEREEPAIHELIPTGHSPVLAYIPDIEVVVGETFIIEPEVWHPDGEPCSITYSGEWMSSNTRYSKTYYNSGQYEVTVTARDAKGYSDSQVVTIDVYEPYNLHLRSGLNLIAYPFEDGDSEFSAMDLLVYLYDMCECVSNISDNVYSSFSLYKSDSLYKKVSIDTNGNVFGSDFLIELGKGYKLYVSDDADITVPFKYDGEEENTIYLHEGMNLVGIAEPPFEGYTSYDVLRDLEYCITGVYRYNANKGRFEATYWLNGLPAGNEFEIVPDEGYRFEMQTALSWKPGE